MTKLEDFHDLIVWQKAHQLTLLVYGVTEKIADDRLKGEIRGSAITIGGKIAAAFGTRESSYSQEMLNLAKAACGGLRVQLTAIRNKGWLNPHDHEELMGRTTEVRQLLFALEHTLEFWRKQRGDDDDNDLDELE